MRNRTQVLIMGALTMITLTMIILMGRPSVDCDQPETWATESGVQACAINGGK